jgi:uncharacterized phage protein (TIGR02218 family)
MKPASPALVSFLASQRTLKDTPLLMADLYTIALQSGTVLTYTNADLSIVSNGVTFVANSILIDGLAYHCKAGLDVDQQQVTIAARPVDTIGGVPFLIALAHGVFDGAEIQRERAFFTSWSAPPVGSVVLFKGRVATIDEIGRTSAKITVASDLVLLDVDMPRNYYQLTCNHTLYDSGCGLTKAAFGTSGSVGAGASALIIPWPGAATIHTLGTILFTSGTNNAVQATIKSAVAGVSLTLNYPLYSVPAAGDTFIAYQGCDHRRGTCQNQFNNLANFRGFPFTPPPTTAY